MIHADCVTIHTDDIRKFSVACVTMCTDVQALRHCARRLSVRYLGWVLAYFSRFRSCLRSAVDTSDNSWQVPNRIGLWADVFSCCTGIPRMLGVRGGNAERMLDTSLFCKQKVRVAFFLLACPLFSHHFYCEEREGYGNAAIVQWGWRCWYSHVNCMSRKVRVCRYQFLKWLQFLLHFDWLNG